MTDTTDIERNRSLDFKHIIDIIIHPRQVFKWIVSHASPLWLTPLLLLSIAVLINVVVVGRLKIQAAMMGEITYPPDFEWYTPEQQAQYMQAIQSTQGPVFVYVLPAISSILGVWFGWLILGGVVHLVTTLFGGRGSTAVSMNIVAWASIPLVLREIVQIIFILVTKKMIINPGLSGFSPSTEGGLVIFFSQILKFLDIYLIWQIILIILGVRFATGLNPVKSSFSVIISILIILLLQAGLGFLGSYLGNLTITRPFFF